MQVPVERIVEVTVSSASGQGCGVVEVSVPVERLVSVVKREDCGARSASGGGVLS